MFRTVWVSILLAFLCVPYVTFGSFLARVSYGLGINPAAVPLFRRRFSKSFLPLIFHRPFACVSHGLGLNPSSFFMRSLGDVRQFSGSCFVRFGHQSCCCCSAVSEAFLHKSFLSLIFHWLFARVSHGLGLNPSSFFTRSLGNVRQFSGSCFVEFGHQSCCCSAVSEAFLQVIPFIDIPLAFRSCFAWFGPQSF